MLTLALIAVGVFAAWMAFRIGYAIGHIRGFDEAQDYGDDAQGGGR